MADIRARLKPLFRRPSTVSSPKSSTSSPGSPVGENRSRSKNSLLLSKSRKPSLGEPVHEIEEKEKEKESTRLLLETAPEAQTVPSDPPNPSLETDRSTLREANKVNKANNTALTLETSTSDPLILLLSSSDSPKNNNNVNEPARHSEENLQHASTADAHGQIVSRRPEPVPRRQSLAHSSQTRFLKTLLEPDKPQPRTPSADYFGGPPTISANMLHRKIWVKRPGASATLVSINEDDLVDDVRDMVLKKYANSLGRNFDAPDVTLRIVPRDSSQRPTQAGERTLKPEEPIARLLDDFFPGGQNVEDALLIDVPPRRTPRGSPRNAVPFYLAEDLHPGESGTEYFPPMPAAGQHSPHQASNLSVTSGQPGSHHQPMHSIAILNSGQVPLLPSPGSRGSRHIQHTHRPKYGRTHTSSPTVINNVSGSQNHGKQYLFDEASIIPAHS